jgi:hypothetical protein
VGPKVGPRDSHADGVYGPVWQEKLREAEADLAAGRVQRFEDDDEFLGYLDALADEAGG